jgi:mono/diheme cytochrome c family protein
MRLLASKTVPVLTALCIATSAVATEFKDTVFSAGHPSLREWLMPDQVPHASGNRPNAARVQLGKMLFFDPRLSGDGNMSCATCHNPAFGWSDGLPKAKGFIATTVLFLFATFSVATSADTHNESNLDSHENPTPTLALGAKVYQERCVLCHGPEGRGDGILPSKIKSYPDTNLFKEKYGNNRKKVHRIVVYGGTEGEVSEFMPPMGNDLTWTEVESVVNFVQLLRANQTAANRLLESVNSTGDANKRIGQEIFSGRCTLCHGKYGEGDGRMAKILKNPPPADLTASRLVDADLKEIIVKGGAAVGRSKHMPPWGEQLGVSELESVLLYLKSIRD